MNYSICLMALVTSQLQQLRAEMDESLQPHLQRIAELVTSFFGERGLARRRPGV